MRRAARCRSPGVFARDLRDAGARSPGEDVILSLDLKVQKVAEAALAGQEGAVVAIDPNTGDVIALVSTPGFDPNLFARGITRSGVSRAWRTIRTGRSQSRAARRSYSSGSTIKPAPGAGGAHRRRDRSRTSRSSAPALSPAAAAGTSATTPITSVAAQVDLDQAIARSCDVYFYGVAHEMGIDRISEWLPLFGFGRPTGIDIGGEKPGLVPSRAWKETHFANPANQVWFPGETVNLGHRPGLLPGDAAAAGALSPASSATRGQQSGGRGW